MSWTVTRAQLAAARRHYPGADTSDLERKLRAERLADVIARTLAQDPPLTANQRRKLAALFHASPASGYEAEEDGDI